MAFEPDVIALIRRIRAEVERTVRRFPRTYRYEFGGQLRREIVTAGRLANRAWRDPGNVERWTRELKWAVDEFRQSLLVGHELQLYPTFATFEMLVRMAEDLGRQCGGWHRQHRTEHPNSQNAPGRQAQGQRAQTLSTPAASQRGHA